MVEQIPPEESLLKFPCDFVIKVFGMNSIEFESAVYGIVHKQVTNFSDRAIQSRSSKNNKYCAISLTVHVESREQLDNIYRALSASPHVLMVL